MMTKSVISNQSSVIRSQFGKSWSACPTIWLAVIKELQQCIGWGPTSHQLTINDPNQIWSQFGHVSSESPTSWSAILKEL